MHPQFEWEVSIIFESDHQVAFNSLDRPSFSLKMMVDIVYILYIDIVYLYIYISISIYIYIFFFSIHIRMSKPIISTLSK